MNRRDDRKRDEAFVQGVLGRTSGSACGRCETLLPDLTDGALDDLDRRLVQGHLEHCAGCRALAVALGWLTPLLPDMAEIDPGEDFTTAVLDATTRRKAWEEAGPEGAAGLMDRLGRWWERQILKPQFTFQAAYVATVVLVLLTAVPGAPLKGAPGKALEVIQAGPQAAPVVGPAMAAASSWLGARTDDALGSARGGIGERWNRIEGDLDARADRTAADRRVIGQRLGSMFDRLGRGELGEAGTDFYAALRAGSGFWKNWWDDNEDVGP